MNKKSRSEYSDIKISSAGCYPDSSRIDLASAMIEALRFPHTHILFYYPRLAENSQWARCTFENLFPKKDELEVICTDNKRKIYLRNGSTFEIIGDIKIIKIPAKVMAKMRTKARDWWKE